MVVESTDRRQSFWGAHMEMEKKRALKNEHFLTFLKKKREEEGAFV